MILFVEEFDEFGNVDDFDEIDEFDMEKCWKINKDGFADFFWLRHFIVKLLHHTNTKYKTI